MSLEIIKSNFAKSTFPYDYNRRLWYNAHHKTNCYAYAVLNSRVHSHGLNAYYYPGAMAGIERTSFYPDALIISQLKKDFASLGKTLLESSLEEVLPKGMQKIFILKHHEYKDFHFYRLDSNGFWSHKDGWHKMPTNIGKGRKKISNPYLEATSSYPALGYFKF